MASREQLDGVLMCPKCKKEGAYTWEENTNPCLGGFQIALLSLPKGFRRKKGDYSDNPKIVCKRCKKIVR
jgi:hypothetical protein